MEVLYKDIPGYEGYRAGTDGSIWSCWERGKGKETSKWKIGGLWKRLLLGKDSDGYLQVKFAKERKTKKVHKLVLELFLGSCPEGYQACHKNGNRADNRVENLRWGTAKSNQEDRLLHGTSNFGSRNGNAKLTESLVREIKIQHKIGKAIPKIAIDFNMHRSVIHKICNGALWSQVVI